MTIGSQWGVEFPIAGDSVVVCVLMCGSTDACHMYLENLGGFKGAVISIN